MEERVQRVIGKNIPTEYHLLENESHSIRKFLFIIGQGSQTTPPPANIIRHCHSLGLPSRT